MDHGSQNIYNLFTVIKEFLDNVYFQHCFNNPPSSLFDLNSKVIWIELGLALFQVDQVHVHIAFNIIKGNTSLSWTTLLRQKFWIVLSNSNGDYCSSNSGGVTNLPHYKNSRPENLGGRGEKIGVFIAETIFAFPGGFIFRMIRPLNLEELGRLVAGSAFRLVKNTTLCSW